MTDKEKLIKTFKEVGVDFEIQKDGDLEVEVALGCVYFEFNKDGKFEEVI